MEFVDGAPLDRYVEDSGLANAAANRADGRGRGGRARVGRLVNLFLPICDAVQYAHQHGVIHRDLKPANIRVDSDGAPRVLDFGLARGAGLGGGEDRGLTASGTFMGSLPWASPEHVCGDSEAIDTRSDVYSLGVILYHLLTGRFPYTVQGPLRDIFDNIARAEPPRPAALSSEVSADLDTIVLKCLAKDPERRYQSAADLAADLRHYLAGEPIQARRDSAWYTLGKRIQRYRWAVAAAGVLVAVIAVALFITLRQWRVADEQRDAAERERVRADEQRQLAERRADQLQVVNDFLADTFSAADPSVRGRDVRVADVLERAAEKADRELADHPSGAIAAHIAIGRSFLGLRLLDRADEQLETAMRLAELHLEPDSVDRLMCAQWLAGLRHQQGRLDEAEALLREGLERATRALGADHSVTLRARQSLANVLGDSGRFREAESLTREVLAARTQRFGPDDRQTLQSMRTLATTLAQQGRLEESASRLEELVEAQRRTQGEEHPAFIDAVMLLAQVLGERNQDLERATGLLAHAREIASRIYGPEDPRTLSIVHDLAVTFGRRDMPGDAIPLLCEVREIQTRILGPSHPDLLGTLCSLATELQRTGRDDEALPLYREVVEKAAEALGPKQPQRLVYTNNYALSLMRSGRVVEAEPHLIGVYQTGVEVFGERHWKTALFRGNLGRAALLQSRFADAEPHFLAAYEALRESLGAAHELTAAAASDLVELYEKWGRPGQAGRFRAPLGGGAASNP